MTDLKNFTNHLPKGWGELDTFRPYETVAEGYTTTETAQFKMDWKLTGFKHPFTAITAFKDQSSDPSVDDRYRITGVLNILQKNIHYEGIIEADGSMFWEPKTTLNTIPDLFSEDRSGWDLMNNWTTLIPLKDMVTLGVLFQPVHSGMQIYQNIHVELTQTWCIDGTKICLKNPYFEVNLIRGIQSTDSPVITGRIGAEFELGKPVDAYIDLGWGELATLHVKGQNDQGLPGPSHLLKAIGFEEQGKGLEDALSNVPLLNDFYLDEVEIGFNLKTRKFVSGGIYGHLQIADYKARFSAFFPNLTLSTWLDPKTPIPVMKLLKNTYPDLGGIPSDLTIKTASVQLRVSPWRFNLDLVIADIWEAEFGPLHTEFKSLQLSVHAGKGKTTTGQLAAKLTLGDVDFSLLAERIEANSKTGWHFKSTVANETPIQINPLLTDLAKLFGLPEPDWVPEAELSGILIDFNTLKKTFEFKAKASFAKRIGPFISSEVELHLKIDKTDIEKPLQINVDGLLYLEGSYLSFNTDFGHKNWWLKVNWKREDDEKGINLLDIVRYFDMNSKVEDVPKELEAALTLNELEFSYHEFCNAVELMAKNDLGIALKLNFFNASNQGFTTLFGIHYDRSFNKIPQVGDFFDKHMTGVQLTEGWLIFSWVKKDFGKTPFPDFGKGWPIPINKMGQGLLLLGKLEIKPEATGDLANLKKIMPNDANVLTLRGQIDFVQKSAKIGLEWKGHLSFPTNGSYPFVLNDCGVELYLSPQKLGITAYGDMEFPLDQHQVKSHVELELSTDNIALKGHAEVPGGLQLFGLKNVKIHSLDIMLGIGFTPPSVEIGLGGELTFRAQQAIEDYFGAQLAFYSPIPEPQFFAIDVSHISLNEILRSLSESTVNNRSFLPERMVEINALSFIWATRNLRLPDGSDVTPGVEFHGLFTVNAWSAWLAFKVSTSVGVSATGQFDKIIAEGIHVTGKTAPIKRLFVKEGNNWIPVSNTKRLLPNAVTEERVLLNGGGALLHFSTYQSPYLKADFDIKLLDVIQTKAGIEVNDQGMSCNVVIDVPALDLLHVDHTVVVKPPSVIQSKGTFTAGPYVTLPFSLTFPFTGHQRVGLFINGNQDIQTGTDRAFHLYFNYNYNILGLPPIPGPVIDIPHAPQNFGDILVIVMKNFWENIVVNICKIILPEFFHFICNALRLQHPNALDPKIIWMNDALGLLDKQHRFELNSGAPSAQFKQLLTSATEETNKELETMHYMVEKMEEEQQEQLTRGIRRLNSEIARYQREIKDLEDANHTLENTIRQIWNDNLEAYKNVLYTYWDAQNNYHQTGKGKAILNKQAKEPGITLEKIREKVMRIATDFDPEKGYSNRKGKWARIAVDYYFDLVKIYMDKGLERDYGILQRLKRTPKLTLKTPIESKVIVCDLKPETKKN